MEQKISLGGCCNVVYNSFGNGSAMRVSPCAWVMDCGFCARTGMWPSNGRAQAKLSAEVTHNHPEGIKGAMATADAIFMCRYYFGGYCGDYETPINDNPTECKKRIKKHIEQEYGYDLSKTLDKIRPGYVFNETCQDTVPQAIIAFLESKDFEDAIRNAISLGGDSDTLAAITGGIAEAAYGIPDWIKEKAYSLVLAALWMYQAQKKTATPRSYWVRSLRGGSLIIPVTGGQPSGHE